MRTVGLVSLFKHRAVGRRWYTAAGPSFEYRQRLPDDPTPRKTCTQCGFVNYENPKLVCGSVLTVKGQDGDGPSDGASGDLIVLGRRNIQPRRGFWGIPAGFLEMGESTEEGAAREAREELNADVLVGDLLAVYSLPHISIIQMIYTSVLRDAEGVEGVEGVEAGIGLAGRGVSAGQETDEVAFFRWEDIPWDSLAFPTTSWALWHHGQRYEHSRSELLRSESSRSGHFSGLLQSGVSPSQGGESVGADSSSILAGDIKQGSGGGGSMRSNSGLGGGRCPGSTGAVFSNPTTNTAHFWCPKRGLHAKGDWNLSADS